MAQEEKQLLLQDLCGRLPYGVKAKINRSGFENYSPQIVRAIYDTGTCYFDYGIGAKAGIIEYNEVLPYLRPMSSMTEEEKGEYFNSYDWEYFEEGTPFDWLNAHHFDYRGLIEKGLALEAPENMYI